MEELLLVNHLFELLKKWLKHLIIIVLLAGVLVAVILFQKPDYYQSSTIFYPASISLQKPVFTEAEQNINYYGDDHDVDRMLSIATSLDTRNEIIKELNLRDHYQLEDDIEDTKVLHRIFTKKYKVIKTEYDAIKIQFEDFSPEMSAEVANYAREKVNDKTKNIIKSAQGDVLRNAQRTLEITNDEIKLLTIKMKEANVKYGVYNTQSQAEAFAILQSTGNDISSDVQKYTDGISLVKSLESQIEIASHHLVKNQSNLNRLVAALESDISTMHVVQKADIPIQKAGPFRSIIILGTMMFAAFISFLFIWLMESINKKVITKSQEPATPEH